MCIAGLAIGVALVAGGCDDRSGGAPAATGTPQRRVADTPSKNDPDGSVVGLFKAHRAAFNELKDMMLADAAIGRITLANAKEGGPNGLSADRRARYAALLGEVGAASVAAQAPGLNPGEVAIAIPIPAGWPAGARASIVFATAIGLQRLDTLGNRLSAGKGPDIARELDINWYLVGGN